MDTVRERGRTTAPDRDALKARFQDLQPGDMINYTDIEETINEDRKSNRYRSVVGQWRKSLEREFNLLLEAENNVGYRVLDNSGRIRNASHTMHNGFKRINKAYSIARKTDEDGLTITEIRAKDHLIKIGSAIDVSFQIAPKGIEFKLVSSKEAGK